MDQHENSFLTFVDRMGWNLYKDCLKRTELDSLNEPKPLAARPLNELEWIFVFKRFGALTNKAAPDLKKLADSAEEKAEVVYILDLRYVSASSLPFLLLAAGVCGGGVDQSVSLVLIRMAIFLCTAAVKWTIKEWRPSHAASTVWFRLNSWISGSNL